MSLNLFYTLYFRRALNQRDHTDFETVEKYEVAATHQTVCVVIYNHKDDKIRVEEESADHAELIAEIKAKVTSKRLIDQTNQMMREYLLDHRDAQLVVDEVYGQELFYFDVHDLSDIH